jgi:CDP-6-deoxy-D-xylo-4-hexulose-3-dehydrase
MWHDAAAARRWSCPDVLRPSPAPPDADELDAIRRVCESDRYTMGEQVRQFEAAFAARFGMKHAVMVNSGSSADLVAVASLFYKRERPLQRGDEAIVPAISWATTYHPLQQYGLKLRFVDVDLHTLNMDATQPRRR